MKKVSVPISNHFCPTYFYGTYKEDSTLISDCLLVQLLLGQNWA